MLQSFGRWQIILVKIIDNNNGDSYKKYILKIFPNFLFIKKRRQKNRLCLLNIYSHKKVINLLFPAFFAFTKYRDKKCLITDMW